MTEAPHKPQPFPLAFTLWSMVGLIVVLAVIFVAFSNWPVVQMYGFAVAAIAYMFLIAVRTARATLTSAGPRPWYQFGLSTLLVWIVPYLAAVTWIATWRGPYEQDFLNANIKSNCIVVLTQFVVGLFAVSASARAARRQRLESAAVVADESPPH